MPSGRRDAVIIGVIVAVSVGLGFVNEYRAEKAAEALHAQIRHETVVRLDGHAVRVDVTALVPGDVVELKLGDVVPADVRLLSVTGLECDESVLTGESLPLDQAPWESPASVAQRTALAGCTTLGVLPFDHERRMVSVVVRDPAGHTVLVTKGAPETVPDRCTGVPPEARHALDAEFAAGNRVVAVASRPFPGGQPPVPADERGLTLLGFLVFLDPPLHAADVGISVDSATDIAKDAADVTLLRQHVLRRGRVALPDVPADAAFADPARQPALRHQPARHPHRQRRRDPGRPRRRDRRDRRGLR